MEDKHRSLQKSFFSHFSLALQSINIKAHFQKVHIPYLYWNIIAGVLRTIQTFNKYQFETNDFIPGWIKSPVVIKFGGFS